MKSLVFFALLSASTVRCQSAIYEQCGGSLWNGPTTCASGTTCQVQNSYYSQCLPGAGDTSGGSSGQNSAPIVTLDAGTFTDFTGDPSTGGSNNGDSSSDNPASNPGAAAPSSPAAAASSMAPAAAASSQPAMQGQSGGGSMNPSPATGGSGGGSSGGGNSGGGSNGGGSTGGSGNSTGGGQSSAQPVTGGACAAYTGDKTGVASTTHYYDGQKGACGCGSGSGMAQWQSGAGGSNIFTAAGSPNLFGGSSTWCGSGCGQCYELKNLGALPAANMGDCTGSGETITVMITNLCPTNGNEQWCSVPDSYGFPAHFDIMSQGGPNGWNNPVVSYKQVTCPGSLTSDYASCQCASGQTSRARRGLFGETNFGY